MSQVIDPPSVPSVQPNVQDVFLNQARRERISVTILLMGGHQMDARIKSFDRFAVLVEVDGVEQLVFKHAIALIASAGPAASARRS
jgi:host factor-I protein